LVHRYIWSIGGSLTVSEAFPPTPGNKLATIWDVRKLTKPDFRLGFLNFDLRDSPKPKSKKGSPNSRHGDFQRQKRLSPRTSKTRVFAVYVCTGQ
jgi:hypothetical protein